MHANENMPIACIDFNGVLDTYQGWRGDKHFDAPRPGAREFLSDLGARGLRVVIFTTRYAPDVWQWLAEHGLDGLVADVTDRKPAAHVFVDDRAVCFRGDFSSTLREVDNFTAHWEENSERVQAIAGATVASSTNSAQRRRYKPQLRRRSS
jgi:hypothetical protein